MRRMCDLLIRPMVADVVYTNALRMSRSDMLAGAAAASRVVITGYSEALSSADTSPLHAFEEAGCLDPALCDHLVKEVNCGHELGQASRMSDLAKQQAQHVANSPTLERLLLIVGCQRAEFDGIGRHQLPIGSHIVVVSQPGQGGEALWRQDNQRLLLAQSGCTIQAHVRFDAGIEIGVPPQRYTFEASVAGEQLRGEELMSGVPWESHESESDGVTFTLVDMNRILRGNAFWETAEEVHFFPAGW
jgi:hypothetical protein